MFSLISKLFNDLPSNFGYTIGEKIEGEGYSIWTHYRGFKKNRPEQSCSVFVFDKSNNTSTGVLGFLPVDVSRKIAKNQFRRCKSLIHPCILKIYDTLEVSNYYYIITEPCISLYNLATNFSFTFETFSNDSKDLEYDIFFPIDCISGLYEVTNGIKFLHNDAKLLHGNISPFNVYVNYEGSWKLGGFENAIPLSEANSNYIDEISRQSTSYNIMGWKFSRFAFRNPKSIDLWNLGCLIYWSYKVSKKLDFVFNTNRELYHQTNFEEKKKLIDSIELPFCNGIVTLENNLIPHWLYDWLSDLLSCLDTNKDINIESGIILMKNNSPFVEFMNQINDFILKSPEDKKDFCIQYLPNLITSVRVNCVYTTNLIIVQRILNRILINFAQCTPTVFPLILTLMESYSSSNCPSFLLNTFRNVLKFLLNQNDRSIRYTLLKNISKYERFTTKDIFQDCIDSILMGFQDTANLIREATLQSMIYIIPLLLREHELKCIYESDKNSRSGIKTVGSNDFIYSIKEGIKNSAAIFNALGSNNNSQVAADKLICSMFNLAKDPEVIIRSNTVICFAKLMNILPGQYYQTILSRVYIQMLKDPLPICRKAVIQAFISTINFFPPSIITQQILPNISIYGFIEGQPEIMEISLLLIKNIANILCPYIQEQKKLKEEQEISKFKDEDKEYIQQSSSTRIDPILSSRESVCQKNIPDSGNVTNGANLSLSKSKIKSEGTKTPKFDDFNDLNNENYVSDTGKSDVNWNNFEGKIFELSISKGNTPRNLEINEQVRIGSQLIVVDHTTNQTKPQKNADFGAYISQRNFKTELMNSLPPITSEIQKTGSNDNKIKISNSSNVSEINSKGKKPSTKLDLNSDDFWKEFE
ncbi:Ser/Thr protein kinase [Cryptosporidium ryanae]|uniref:Ser/Thr protein kinase n=1 Tax=Cryptosporidium ryanae TaxID=515981 RepID=UPI00351A089A|nr:Ser/Thr protein kinase [Cryptosporidium ryanae]